jgi:hypothetical protein
MIDDVPGDLQASTPGASAIVTWLNRVKAAVVRRTLLPGTGYQVRHTTSGVILQIRAGGPGGTASGITYEGDYDSTRSYSRGMIVRKRTGTSQGLYISNLDVPAGAQPVFPEPGSGPVYWHLWTLAPQQYTECSDDPNAPTRNIWVHASGQF